MKTSENLKIIIEEFNNDQSVQNAIELGKALTISTIPVKEKKEIFKELFNNIVDDKKEAIINLWATASMIEYDISIPQKVMGVRGFIEDPSIKIEWIEEWIKTVWKRKKAPQDFLEFIAVDLRNIDGLSAKLKKMLFQE